MRTPSLRRRVVLWSVAVLALLLLVVGVAVDLALGAMLRAEQRTRLESVAALAQELTGLSDQDLANRLAMPGIRATVISAAGHEVVGVAQPKAPGSHGGPPAPPPAAKPKGAVTWSEAGQELSATVPLRSGGTVRLSTDSTPIETALDRFRLIMAVTSAAAIALAAVALPLVLRRAMRPLDALTLAARETAAGGRGRRLQPRDPGTDLGRAAAQFDAMLEELESAEQRAEQAAERLARFLSDASHELRTPLAGVSAGAERLIRGRLEQDERDRVEVQVVREARRAARLVDDLLLVSRLGELRVEPERQQLGVLLREAAGRADGMAVDVVVGDVEVEVDSLRFGQVLANLLGNATAAGAGRVRIAVSRSHGTVAIRVSDDGPGIPADKREAVFERLVRLDPARSAARGGAGLGLPIARGLTAAHGGTLRAVEPGPGDLPGAVLLLTLPARPAVARYPHHDARYSHPQAVGAPTA